MLGNVNHLFSLCLSVFFLMILMGCFGDVGPCSRGWNGVGGWALWLVGWTTVAGIMQDFAGELVPKWSPISIAKPPKSGQN